ncbi:MAG: Sec-independent protein translocase protein TatB [Magnetospiraceae bacterium]
MLDIGWSEIGIIAAIAIIFIGPKDLPRALKTLGQWVAKIRSLTREFRSAVDDMIREAELEDVKKQIDDVRGIDMKKKVTDAVDPNHELEDIFAEDWDTQTKPAKSEAKAVTSEPAAPETAPAETNAEGQDEAQVDSKNQGNAVP